MLTGKQIEEEFGWKEGGFFIIGPGSLSEMVAPSYYESTFPQGIYPFKFHFHEKYQLLIVQRFHSDGDILYNGRCHDLETLKVILKICKDGTVS